MLLKLERISIKIGLRANYFKTDNVSNYQNPSPFRVNFLYSTANFINVLVSLRYESSDSRDNSCLILTPFYSPDLSNELKMLSISVRTNFISFIFLSAKLVTHTQHILRREPVVAHIISKERKLSCRSSQLARRFMSRFSPSWSCTGGYSKRREAESGEGPVPFFSLHANEEASSGSSREGCKLFVSCFLRHKARLFFPSLPLSLSLSSFTSRTIIERVPVHGCDKLEGREEQQRAKSLEVNLATASDWEMT